MDKQDRIEWALDQLKGKRDELGRLPKKSDFDDVTRSRIKTFLGPWPRALEMAGLKSVSPVYQRRAQNRSGSSYRSRIRKKKNA